jgi:hypothetical protein
MAHPSQLPSTRQRPWRRRALALAASAALAGLPLGAAADFVWSSGFYAPGVTAPSPLGAADVLRIEAGGFKYVSAVTLQNQGTVRWLADALYLQSGGIVDNQGLWDAEADLSLFNNGGAMPAFLNSGTFRKSAGSGTLVVSSIGFVNSGLVQAQSGTIQFNGGSVFNAGSSFSGAGRTLMASGTNTFNGSFAASNLGFASGTLQGNAALLNGQVDWTGGTLQGSWTVAAGQALNGQAGNFKVLSGAGTVLANQGRIGWDTGEALYLQSGALLRNEALFEAGASAALLNNGGAQPGFANTASGTLRAAAGQTLSVGAVGFVNQGGRIEALAGGTVNFNGHGASFEDGSLFTGAGTVLSNANNSFAGRLTAENLRLNSNTHAGLGAVVQGNLLFAGGALAGTWEVAAGHRLSGVAGNFKYLSGADTVLTNRGLLSWDTGEALYLQSGASLVNHALLEASTSTAFLNNGGAQPTLVNRSSGVLRAAAGQTFNIGSVALRNEGGQLDAAAGATLQYSGGDALFQHGSRFTGAGRNLVVSNASFQGNQQSGNLVLQGGTFSGDAAVVQGLLRWTGGTLAGGWTVAAGQQLQVADGSFKYLSGAATTLLNQGTLALESGQAIYLQSGAALVNAGLLSGAQGSALLNNGGAQPTLTNTAAGTLHAQAGASVNIGSVALQNQGGVLLADAGATLQVSGGNASFGAGSRFNGAGRNLVNNNASFSGNQQSQNLELAGGSFSGSSAVLAGQVLWSGGTLTGTWTVAAGQQLRLGSGAFKVLSGAGTVLDNQGLTSLDAGQGLYLQSAALMTNAGSLVLADGSGIFNNGGAAPQLTNTGLIQKATGAGTATLGNGLGLQNLGTVEVGAGMLTLPSNFSNAGRLAGLGQFSTNLLSNAGVVAPGADLGNGLGALGLAGSFAQTAAGTLALQLAGLAAFDQFNISGNASLGGKLALHCAGACAIAAGQSYVLLDAAGTLTGQFDLVSTSGFGQGFQYSLVYDLGAAQVRLDVLQAGVVPEPASWALLLAGAALLAGLQRRRA